MYNRFSMFSQIMLVSRADKSFCEPRGHILELKNIIFILDIIKGIPKVFLSKSGEYIINLSSLVRLSPKRFGYHCISAVASSRIRSTIISLLDHGIETLFAERFEPNCHVSYNIFQDNIENFA